MSGLESALQNAGQFGASPEEQLATVRRQREMIGSARGGIMGAAGQASAMGGFEDQKASVELERKRLGLLREEYTIQQQIGDAKLTSAQESLQSAKDELQTMQQILQAEENRLLTAKERFGALSNEEQASLIGLKRRADQEGFGSLSREEQARLASVGTRSVQEQVSQARLRQAEQAGFSTVFGEQEREKIRRSRQQIASQRLEVDAQTEVVVNIKQDNQQILSSIKQQIRQGTQLLAPMIQKLVQQELQQAKRELRNEQQQRLNAANQAGRG